MPILLHKPQLHDLFDLAPERRSALHVLRAGGRNMRISIPDKWISLWLPLSGDIEMQAAECRWLLRRGEALVWREGPLLASSRRAGWWLAVCGSPSAWERHLLPRPGEPAMEIFPWEGHCPRELRRPVVHLARVAAQPETGRMKAESAADMLCEAIAEHQRGLLALLARCSGRTLQRRQQTLLRLLRVRHLIHRHENGRLDLAYLAASANYSPCHLIRSYREVFGETPSEHATRRRLERAWQIVSSSDMPVCEIAELLGFESQSAFCRAFKDAHGMTTGQARRGRQNNRLAA